MAKQCRSSYIHSLCLKDEEKNNQVKPCGQCVVMVHIGRLFWKCAYFRFLNVRINFLHKLYYYNKNNMKDTNKMRRLRGQFSCPICWTKIDVVIKMKLQCANLVIIRQVEGDWSALSFNTWLVICFCFRGVGFISFHLSQRKKKRRKKAQTHLMLNENAFYSFAL